MLLLILNSHTDEGFGRNVYKNVFFLSSYIYIYIYIYHIYHIGESVGMKVAGSIPGRKIFLILQLW